MDEISGQTGLYQGAVPTYEAPQQQQVQAHRADYDAMAKQAGQTLNRGIKLLDFYQQMQEEDAQVQVETERAKDYQNRMAKAAGTAGSFLNKDGSTNEDEVAKFNAQWADRYRQTHRMRFDGEDALRARASMEHTLREWGQQTETQVNADMIKATRDIWETRMKIFEANGDTAAMRAHLQKALEAGLLREDEVELMRIRMAKSAARGGGGGGRTAAATRTAEQQRAVVQNLPKAKVAAGVDDGLSLTSTAGGSSTADSLGFSATGQVEPQERQLTFGDESERSQLDAAADKQFNEYMEKDAGNNPFSDISLRTDGFAMMDAPTFDEVRAADVAELCRGSITLDTASGRDIFTAPAVASDATFGMVDRANALDGYEAEQYGQDIRKVAMRYSQDEQMAGMSKSTLKKNIKDAVMLEGGDVRWFDGDTIAFEGFIETEIDKVLDFSDGPAFKHFGAQVQSINNVGDIQGLVRSGVLHESFMKPADLEGAFGALTTEHWWGGNLVANETVREMWDTYGEAYLRESGKEKGKGLEEHYKGFRDWALAKDGVVAQAQKQYAVAVKDIVETRVADALTNYFSNGGTSEAEAIKACRDALKRPLTGAELGPQAAIAAERKKRDDKQHALAAKYRTEAEDANKRLKHYQARAGEVKEAEKKAEEDAKAAAKTVEKADTQEKQDERKRRKQLASPMKQSVRWDGNNDETPYVAVQRTLYDELMAVHGNKTIMGLPGSRGVGAVFADGSGRVIPVKAGDGSGILFSHGALVQEWPRANKRQLKGLCNGVNKTIQFLPY